MEWHIPPIARKSYLSGESFAMDDAVACTLVKTDEGELERVDVLLNEVEGTSMPGKVLCRWTQRFKAKPDEGREEAEALKLTADNLFLSLFEEGADDALDEENAELKHFLALMLERRRVLRVKSRNRRYTRYVHRHTKRELLVPAVDLDPKYFLENQEVLSTLMGEADGQEGEPEEAPAEKAD